MKELRALARQCGTEQTARGDVGKAKVMEMITDLRAASLDEHTSGKVEATAAAYLGTFGETLALAAPEVSGRAFRLRGTSFFADL